MEEMKGLIIQSLETKGVLGQIRAHLRSAVFKIVDEQDQQYNMGCGLKWENPTLYKILDTKIGTTLSEIIREFMEFFRMDYSLSIFIPECGISPERLKKEEILSKLGIFDESFLKEMTNQQTPLIYFIMYYFIHHMKTNPAEVMEVLRQRANDVEQSSDNIISANIDEYIRNHRPDEVPNDMPSSGGRSDEVQEQPEPSTNENQKINSNTNANEDLQSNSQSAVNSERVASVAAKRSQPAYDDTFVRRGRLTLDDSDDGIEEQPIQKKEAEKEIEKEDKKETKQEQPSTEQIEEDIVDDIEEKIEVSLGDSNDKKSGSNNTQTVSQSLGNDATVDSHALENMNYLEPVEGTKK